MKLFISMIISMLIFLGSFFTVHAESPLNGNDIQHFMNAMKPLQALGEKHDFGDSKDAPAENFDLSDFSPMSRSLEEVKDHKAYAKFEKIIHNAGFSSPQRWAAIGDRIMKAYMSLKMAAEMTPEKMKEMQVSIEEIEKNEYLSPEMKKQLLNSMKQMMTMTQNMSEGTKADQETLKPYLAKLDRLFEEQQ